MADEFLEELQTNWRGQGAEFTEAHERLRRQRWWPHLALGYELAATVVVMGVGVWFALMAWKLDSLLFGMSAVILLLAAPALAVAAYLARKDSLRWEEETPESVLVAGVRRADASLRIVRLGRVHLAVIAAFVALLWACETAGLIHARDFLVLYTVVCAVTVACYLPWLAWREKRVRQERDTCQRLLREIAAGEGEGSR